MESVFSFYWIQIGNGRMSIWHRPKLKAIPHLQLDGCSRIVTLLSEKEGAQDVGKVVKDCGMEWTWLPMQNGEPPTAKDTARILPVVEFLSQQLDRGESILIHCSAGIHRTGMIAYVLLRRRGFSSEETVAAIVRMRALTAQGLQSMQLEWGETIHSIKA